MGVLRRAVRQPHPQAAMRKSHSLAVSFALVAFPFTANAALIGFEAENGSSVTTTVAASLGADFDPPQSDPGASGGAYITTETDGGGNTPGSDPRTVSYDVTFLEAGTYDLYARLFMGPGGNSDDSLFYARGFGDADPTADGGDGNISWATVNGLEEDFTPGEYFWVNLSQAPANFGEAGSTFEVNDAGSLTWEVGGREDGLRMDAFAFGTEGETFTDAELSASVVPEPSSSALIAGGLVLGACRIRRRRISA